MDPAFFTGGGIEEFSGDCYVVVFAVPIGSGLRK